MGGPRPRIILERLDPLSNTLHDLAASAGSTWNARLGLPLARLDWILGSEEFVCHSSEVIRAGQSDHWPVLADLEFRQKNSQPGVS